MDEMRKKSKTNVYSLALEFSSLLKNIWNSKSEKELTDSATLRKTTKYTYFPSCFYFAWRIARKVVQFKMQHWEQFLKDWEYHTFLRDSVAAGGI